MHPKSPRASRAFISNVALSRPGRGSALGYNRRVTRLRRITDSRPDFFVTTNLRR